jgi:hypothetical protein
MPASLRSWCLCLRATVFFVPLGAKLDPGDIRSLDNLPR